MSTQNPGKPLISIIIPTYQRPELLLEAVRSALGQTYRHIEVLVVLDGEQPRSESNLASIHDPRLKTIRLSQSVGNASARNAGICAARGDWIALLDDDDLWMPEKLERQWETAQNSRVRYPVVSCRLIARNETGEFLWPRRLPLPGQPVSEYIFCRNWPSTGDGIVQTSTILAPAELFRKVMFQPGLRRLVDLDWILRAAREPGMGLEFVSREEPLVIWRIEAYRRRVTNGGNWKWDLQWIRTRRHLVTRRSYGAFVLTLPSVRAARESAKGAFTKLIGEAFRYGRPGLAELVYHLGNFAVPVRLRRGLAATEPEGRSPLPVAPRHRHPL